MKDDRNAFEWPTSYKDPYSSVKKNMKTLFLDDIGIPMIQREFAWEKDNIIKFLNDNINHPLVKGIYYGLGQLLAYRGQATEDMELSDGQSRVTSTFLTIMAIKVVADIMIKQYKNDDIESEILTDITADVINLLTHKKSKLLPENVIRQEKRFKDVQEPDEMKFFPRLSYSNPDDNQAIVDICNTHLPEISYRLPESHVCGKGKIDCKSKGMLTKHIKSQHAYDINNYTKAKKDTNIYTAYEFVCGWVVDQCPTPQHLQHLFQYICDKLHVVVEICDDQNEAVWKFRVINTNTVTLDQEALAKSAIMSSIPSHRRVSVFDDWTTLSNTKHHHYPNYWKGIFACAIGILTRNFMGTKKSDVSGAWGAALGVGCDNEKNTHVKVQKFFQIIRKLYDIMDKLATSRWGRLILDKTASPVSWSAYAYLILPIHYINLTETEPGKYTVNVDDSLMRLIVDHKVLTMNTDPRGLGKRIYEVPFTKIANDYLKDKTIKYCTEARTAITKANLPNIKTAEAYILECKDKNWYNKNSSKHPASLIFGYLETAKSTSACRPPFDNRTIEHVISQNEGHRLGNLLPLEGKKTDGVQDVANYGAGTNMDLKKKAYANSSYIVTKEFITNYTGFGSDDIGLRTDALLRDVYNTASTITGSD